MSFDTPIIIFIALIAMPISIAILRSLKDPFVASVPLGAPGGTPFKSTQIGWLVKLLAVLECAGIVLLFVSAANPVVKKSETVWLNRGADIVFILDISPSMAAIDMDGANRFTAARNLIYNFIQKRPSDNIGLVALGTHAALLIPPTTDKEALNTRLSQLRLGDLGEDTALGMGLAVAAYHLDKSDARRKAAVLITDGENNAGHIHPETAASILRNMGVTLYVIAVGSSGRVPIDYLDPVTRHRHTGILDFKFEVNNLRRLSDIGSGTFISAPSLDAFTAAFNQLDDAELTVQRSRVIHKREPLFFQFFIPALVLLLAVRLIRRRIMGAIV